MVLVCFTSLNNVNFTLQIMADRLPGAGQHNIPAAASGPVMQDVSLDDEVRLIMLVFLLHPQHLHCVCCKLEVVSVLVLKL